MVYQGKFKSMVQKPSRGTLSHELRSLSKLVGKWTVTLRWFKDTHKLVGGSPAVETQAEISLLKEAEGGFLHYRIGSAHWIIGADKGNTKEYNRSLRR